MVDFQYKPRYGYEDFLEIMKLLRAPGGCPWDREQTHASIRRNFLEETYEVLDAIDRDDPHAMCEELGDVLMQVVFHAQIEEEAGRFTMEDVVDGVAQKLVYRHPHVFGGTMEADTSEQVLVNWEALKRKEKGQRSTADAVESVPHTLPALWRAEKIQSKTAKAGFDWSGALSALDKLEEEVRELRAALESGAAADSPQACLEAVAQAIAEGDMTAFEQHVDVDGILTTVVDKLFVEARRPENAGKLPPMLNIMFSGAALADGGGRVRKMLRGEARAFLRNGIVSGAFAGRAPSQDFRSEGLIAPLFDDASLGRKEIHGIGKASPRKDGGWNLPFRVFDAGNGNDYHVVGRFARKDGRVMLTGIDNLDELFTRIAAEAAALEE